ncbi:uncharacterized protein [Anoplolepis gracilipes]|uniref:uncharacterized protein n=1 Tax=Anoplolepis gracilipes TaxID=354296 RepID=UPI003BA2A787
MEQHRAQLDEMSMEQLREEVLRYRLPLIPDRERLLDSIVSHLERHGPVGDLLGTEQRPSQERMDESDDLPVTAERLRQVLTAVTTDMSRYQQEMQQQQQQFLLEQQREAARQQQQFLQQLMQLLGLRREEVPARAVTSRETCSLPVVNKEPLANPSVEVESLSGDVRAVLDRMEGLPTGNAVQWLHKFRNSEVRTSTR